MHRPDGQVAQSCGPLDATKQLTATQRGRDTGDRSRSAANLVEVLMHEGDGHAALAHRSGDALDGTKADIPTGKDARDARLQEERVPVALPPSGGANVEAGEHVALR